MLDIREHSLSESLGLPSFEVTGVQKVGGPQWTDKLQIDLLDLKSPLLECLRCER